MRRNRIRGSIYGISAALICIGAQSAFADTVIYDSFSATNNTALGGTAADVSGFTWGAPASPPIDNYITGSGLSYPTAAQAGDSSYNTPPATAGLSVTLSSDNVNGDKIALTSADNTSFASGQGISTNDYYSLLLNVPSSAVGDLSANGQYSVNAAANTATTSSNNYALVSAFGDGNGLTGGNPGTQITGIYVQQGTVAGTFQIGIGGNRSGVVWDPTNIAAGTPVFLVAEWVNEGSGSYTSSLWLDPTLGTGTAPAADETTSSGQAGGFNDSQINSFSLSSEAGLPTLADGGLQVDEVRIGDEWTDVDPAGTAVPEPASLGLLGVSGLLLLRRRRRS